MNALWTAPIKRIFVLTAVMARACVSISHAAPPSQSETLNLLNSNQFSELNQRFSAVQSGYKIGPVSDEELRAAFRVFYVTDAGLEPKYNLWVEQMPNSYVAHLARGIYYKKVGQERRGGKFIGETSETQLRGMEDAFSKASEDLRASLLLDDRPLLTYLHAMDLRMADGDNVGARELLDKAIAIDPRNFIVREKYMVALQTRWGGSVEEMQTFLHECQKAGLSAGHLKTLAGLVAEDEGWVHQYQDGDSKAAVRAYRKAAKLNPTNSCLPCGPMNKAADVLFDKKDYKGAVKLYSKVLAVDSKSTHSLDNRAFAELQLKRPHAAVADLLQAAGLGDAYAEDLLGRMYLMGTSIPQDRDRAIEWLKKAADQGYAPAQALLPMAMDRNKTPLPLPGGPRF